MAWSTELQVSLGLGGPRHRRVRVPHPFNMVHSPPPRLRNLKLSHAGSVNSGDIMPVTQPLPHRLAGGGRRLARLARGGRPVRRWPAGRGRWPSPPVTVTAAGPGRTAPARGPVRAGRNGPSLYCRTRRMIINRLSMASLSHESISIESESRASESPDRRRDQLRDTTSLMLGAPRHELEVRSHGGPKI